MDVLGRAHLRNSALLFLMLLGLWLLMSGHYDAFHISMGVLSAALVVALNRRLQAHLFRQDNAAGYTPIRFARVLLYIPWLLWEIILASLQVAQVVLSPRMPIDPSFVRFKTRYPNALARVILANSITLTPGTITVELEGDEFLVHALLDVSAAGILDDSMPRKVAGLFRRRPGPVVSDIRVLKTTAEV